MKTSVRVFRPSGCHVFAGSLEARRQRLRRRPACVVRGAGRRQQFVLAARLHLHSTARWHTVAEEQAIGPPGHARHGRFSAKPFVSFAGNRSGPVASSHELPRVGRTEHSPSIVLSAFTWNTLRFVEHCRRIPFRGKTVVWSVSMEAHSREQLEEVFARFPAVFARNGDQASRTWDRRYQDAVEARTP